tara:strand:+ start:3129 stop:3806 length:678 start_codon:yes stop_codon:yes gene_type:complete
MFEELAPKYDFMNSVITFGLYKKWQKKLVEQINPKEGEKILDTATGTGDIAILLSRKKADIFASDLSLNMLKIAKKRSIDEKDSIKFFIDDASTPKINNLDAITISFGIRNIPNIKKTIQNHVECLKPGGRWGCLETAEPENPLLRMFFNLWMMIMPIFAKFFKAPKSAYAYLRDSVKTFPRLEMMKKTMEKSGLKVIYAKELFPMGAILLIGEKSEISKRQKLN